ncbi:MAG TPA: hypothetical protein VJM13_03755, partial [Sphingopyxis sp.]|nr:hypothetical protein [Sphingopyxis sp.]
MNRPAFLRQFATIFRSSGMGLGQIAPKTLSSGRRSSPRRSPEGVRYVIKKISLLTLGAALV